MFYLLRLLLFIDLQLQFKSLNNVCIPLIQTGINLSKIDTDLKDLSVMNETFLQNDASSLSVFSTLKEPIQGKLVWLPPVVLQGYISHISINL